MRKPFLALAAVICIGLACLWQSNDNAGSAQSVLATASQAFSPAAAQKHAGNKGPSNKVPDELDEPIRMRESKPVTVKDVRFLAAAQTNWIAATPQEPFPMVSAVEIQLQIQNVGKSTVALPTFNSLALRILNADGKEVKRHVIAKGTIRTRPILIQPGASYCVCPRAELSWNEKTKAAEFAYFDDSGSKSAIGPLLPGSYTLLFEYSVPGNTAAQHNAGEFPLWAGEATTEGVPIVIADRTIRGRATAGAQALSFPTDTVRVRESAPVTINDTRVVAVAEVDWRPGQQEHDVPVQIQLRITNVSKGDLIFPTNCTFGVRLVKPGGTQIMHRGGADHITITRPVFVAKGESYSLCRPAALHWNAKTNAAELVFWPRPGTNNTFGPLQPGWYRLSIFYNVPPALSPSEKQERRRRDAATWEGDALTTEVPIEVLNR